MKQIRKNLASIAVLTIIYTIVMVLYFIPQSQTAFVFNIVTKFFKDIQTEWSANLLIKNQESNNVEQSKTQMQEQVNKSLNNDFPTYHIKASLDGKNYKIKGSLDLTIDNPETKSVVFYTYSYSWLPMKIEKVYLNEMEVPFTYDQQQITFKNPLDEKKLNIFIEFETPIPRKGTRFGYKDNVWLLTTWYPMLGVLDDNNNWINRPDPIGMGDPFLFNYANYVVEWTTSPSIKWFSSGNLVSEEPAADKGKKTWEIEGVRNFALVGSKSYKIRNLKLNEKTSITIALTDESKFDQVINIVKNSFPLFTKQYGKLPYSNFAVVETGYNTNFALEYPNLAIYSKDLYSSNDLEHWLPHEIGHLWWYNAVGVNEVGNGWLDEGLAELGVVLYFENRYSKAEGQHLRKEYRERNKILIEKYPNQQMNVGLYGFNTKDEFKNSWYARSSDMFLTLREKLGEEDFNKFIRTLYSTNIGKTIDETSLNEALNKSLGLETSFFKNWIHDPYQQTNWEVKLIKSLR